MAQISITRLINYGGKVGMLHFILTLIVHEMTSSRRHVFNDMAHLVSKYIKIYHGQNVL
jgi:hypothetical protein